MLTIARSALALTVALLFWGCSEDTIAAPTVSRVVFVKHTATLLSGDFVATSVSVFKTDGAVVANPPVTYTSSNADVATVDEQGRVYAHRAGQATISVAVGSITDELAVTVLWPPVKSVFLTHDSVVMHVGDTFLIGIWVVNSHGNDATNATLVYTSSTPNVATAADGPPYPGTGARGVRLAGLGKGRVTITATAERVHDSVHVIVCDTCAATPP